MNKIFLIMILFFLITTSFAQTKIGRIKDADGYVNIRKESNSRSKVVDTINETEVFEYLENKSDWWWITKLNGNKGFVHKSRIKEEFKGIIFKDKVYYQKEYTINNEIIEWKNLTILVVKIVPKLESEEKEVYDGKQSVYTGIAKCSAQIRIFSNNAEINRLEYLNIESVGGGAGISFPKNQKLGKFLFGCKYGGYNGRLIQIDTLGKINTYPGGNFLITPDKKYVITTWDSDITGVTVIDLDKGKEYFRKELEDGCELGEWYESNGEYYAYRTDDNSEDPNKIFKVNIFDKTIKNIKMYFNQIRKYNKIKLMDDFIEKGCKCAQ